jgi:purine-binding chemotaxis protein CheW
VRQFISFDLAGERYAIDILLAREVGRLSGIRRVPEARSHLLGIVNLRGQILTVLDPRCFLGHAPANFRDERPLLILKTLSELGRIGRLTHGQLEKCEEGNCRDDGFSRLLPNALDLDIAIKDPLALLVDRIGEALAVEEADILPPLPNLPPERRDLIAGLIRRGQDYIAILALDRLIQRL